MQRILKYTKAQESDYVFTTLLIFSGMLIVFAFITATPAEIFKGMIVILTEPARLVTDYMELAGIGAAFFNSGILMLFSIFLLKMLHLPFTGMSVSCCFLMGGFALFGKNPFNVLPILCGAWLYSLYRKEKFSKYIYIALFGTTLSPIVTEMSLAAAQWKGIFRLAFPLVVGILIGFVLPGISAYTLRVHQGYNLYNVGFAAGMVGVVLVSMLKSFGNEYSTRLLWSSGNNLVLGVFLFLIFGVMILLGWYCNDKSFKGVVHITRHSGRTIADFIVMDGYPVTLMNMGIVGAFSTAFVILSGGALNGPTIGGIFTIVGFGSFGKHMKNIIWVMLGAVIATALSVRNISEPAVLLAVLFSTGLAPIAGHYGPMWGIVAGMMHAWVVLNVGGIFGGLNLYNNGFAAGLVCIVLLPLIQSLRKEDGR